MTTGVFSNARFRGDFRNRWRAIVVTLPSGGSLAPKREANARTILAVYIAVL